jgi:hypothetical protein
MSKSASTYATIAGQMRMVIPIAMTVIAIGFIGN